MKKVSIVKKYEKIFQQRHACNKLYLEKDITVIDQCHITNF